MLRSLFMQMACVMSRLVIKAGKFDKDFLHETDQKKKKKVLDIYILPCNSSRSRNQYKFTNLCSETNIFTLALKLQMLIGPLASDVKCFSLASEDIWKITVSNGCLNGYF